MLTPKRRPQIEGIFAPRSPLEFLGFALVSGMVGLLSSGNLLGLIFVPLFAIAWWWFDRRRNRKLAAATSYSMIKEPPCAARGLLLLLSSYDPRHSHLKDPAVLYPLMERIIQAEVPTAADFEAINLLGSNLLPQIRAVEYHVQRGALRDVWLVATETYGAVTGSDGAAAILHRYLRYLQRQDGLRQFDVHCGVGLTVREYDYAGLWRMVEGIFQRSGYKDERLVADVTGGNKMMSVAIAMACIPPGRRMQYMDGRRDWDGTPLAQGEMSPVVIDIDPMLYAPDAPPR